MRISDSVVTSLLGRFQMLIVRVLIYRVKYLFFPLQFHEINDIDVFPPIRNNDTMKSLSITFYTKCHVGCFKTLLRSDI